ncbi:MAG: DnaJ domain-containing protein [Solirubrobacterales bacterium]|nr:DnaJ domain-containing protein [Solirubrobacterales bacterium]MBV9716146.1 DnaJ domain-containing protein [Solirubrobacterales bacterium]
MASDPYKTLGIKPDATEAELRAAYRRLVQRHHPDHNQGSAEAARRFEEVQEAYAQVRRLRAADPRIRAGRAADQGARAGRAADPGTRAARDASARPAPDPHLDARMADLERQVRQAGVARERARRAAAAAAAEASAAASPAASRRPERPTDEELGYIKTDDSFTKILADAREEIAHHFAEAREHPVAKRVSDLIDGLDELASKLDPKPGSRRR